MDRSTDAPPALAVDEHALIRVNRNVLDALLARAVPPVVILAAEAQEDGTTEMTLQTLFVANPEYIERAAKALEEAEGYDEGMARAVAEKVLYAAFGEPL